MARAAIPELAIAPGPVSPGDLICGHVTGAPEDVRLVRFEASPAGTVPVVLEHTTPDADGAFRLPVPENSAPTVSGGGCAISYGVRAGSSRRARHDPVVEIPVVAPLVRVSLTEATPLHDRMIAALRRAPLPPRAGARRPPGRRAHRRPGAPRPRRSAAGGDDHGPLRGDVADRPHVAQPEAAADVATTTACGRSGASSSGRSISAGWRSIRYPGAASPRGRGVVDRVALRGGGVPTHALCDAGTGGRHPDRLRAV